MLSVMDHLDINRVLRIYLGTDANGGFQPVGCEKRLRSAFPTDYSRMMELASPYLDEHQSPDFSRGGLVEERDRFADALRQKFPELDDVCVRALANRWSYDYR